MTSPPHPRGDGDGWVECALGHRHWGLFGAAGLLVHRPAADGPAGAARDAILLQHRATWSHHGGTWGLPGGARNSGEAAVDAALREATEEAGLDGTQVQVHGRCDEAHGGWTYATVLATAAGPLDARPTGGESIDVAWVDVAEVNALPLHPGFAATWPLLRAALQPVTVVVDAANVVGSRADGWWRDRAGAARRLLHDIASLTGPGLDGDGLPAALGLPPLRRWWPRWVVVLEGQARSAAPADAGPGRSGVPRALRVVVAPRSGDDTVVDEVAAVRGPAVVVTADRELRARAADAGAAPVGPRWLTEGAGAAASG